ncbi:MFS transporter [Saccharothrix variisporea]|uniref:Putative MFS family arabinose efflux permease n=1 Tax=Saccharothrix variisporea TaxID=543527 RepID=A0A495XC57_9PSEU|nr:MFS transporter [Saccharothrix variisporea]RKT71840.1 putative MFS family arabinose efflux permease [Saccharothrix variisporea]
MRSYRSLFRAPEFTPFLLSFAAFAAAQTIGGLALGTLVFRATGSPFLSALSMFGPQLAQLLGGLFLLSAADRVPPRATLTGLGLAFAVTTAVLALSLPVWALFAVLLLQGVVASLGGGVRGGLLTEILSKDGYVLGRSVYNMLWGLVQVTGFATGGLLLTLLSPQSCLLLAAALYALSALVTRLGLTARPPRSKGRPSIAATWRTNALLLSSRARLLTYLGLWVPNGLVVGGDSLYVSYAPHAAGTLYACGALGMFAGDLAVGRLVPPALRPKLATPLRLLLAVPYLFFVLHPGVVLSAVAVTIASAGFAASLVLQERLMSLAPDDLSGQVLGLHGTGMVAFQGIGVLLAGTLAQLTSPGTAITLTAATSATVTLVLAALARRSPARV